MKVFKSSLFALLFLSLNLYSSFNYISLEILIGLLIILNYSFFYLKKIYNYKSFKLIKLLYNLNIFYFLVIYILY
jgi:hypothetical protein